MPAKRQWVCTQHPPTPSSTQQPGSCPQDLCFLLYLSTYNMLLPVDMTFYGLLALVHVYDLLQSAKHPLSGSRSLISRAASLSSAQRSGPLAPQSALQIRWQISFLNHTSGIPSFNSRGRNMPSALFLQELVPAGCVVSYSMKCAPRGLLCPSPCSHRGFGRSWASTLLCPLLGVALGKYGHKFGSKCPKNADVLFQAPA